MIVTAELVKHIGTNKFIPVIRQTGNTKNMPVFLGARKYIDFSTEEEFEEKIDELE